MDEFDAASSVVVSVAAGVYISMQQSHGDYTVVW